MTGREGIVRGREASVIGREASSRRGTRSSSWRRRAISILATGVAVSLVAAGCKPRPTGDDIVEQAEPAASATLPELKLGDETPDLLLTWVDGKGDAHVANKVTDVPTEGRDHVRVVVTTDDHGTGSVFYVANLTVKGGDGNYPVSTMTRREWDNLISQRRIALAPPAASGAPGEPAQGDPQDPSHAAPTPAGFTVIIYGASWCGACHQAVAHLKKRKVPVIEKDIEQDPAAESEMRAKLARAGVHGGSIPVIDVKGKILVGFEPHALDAAVAGSKAIAL